MFNKQKQIKILDAQIVKWLDSLDEIDILDPQYDKRLEVIESLQSRKDEIETTSKLQFLRDPEVVTGVLGFIGITMVLNYEKTEVVTSKAFNIATDILKG